MQPLLIAVGLLIAGLSARAILYFVGKFQQVQKERINKISRVLHLPQIQIPSETPSIQTPSIEIPAVNIPSIQVPSIQTAPIEIPSIQIPSVQIPPSQELTTVELPSIHISNIEKPHIELPHFPDTASTEPLLQAMHPDPAFEKPEAPTPIELTPPPSSLQSPYMPENPELIEKRKQRKNKIRNLFLGGEILD